MNALGSCGGSISGEHLVSEAIIKILQDNGNFTVSGLPWLAEGLEKALAPKNLTANCLCRKHNSALSPLDNAAALFFRAIKSGLEQETRSTQFIVSGHDIERWLLKTVKAMAASRNLSQDRQRLSGSFAKDVKVLEMLDDPKSWPAKTGLYCVMKTGETTENNHRFQLYPLVRPQGDISGIGVNILGLSFQLILEDLDMAEHPQLAQSQFRPAEIAIHYPSSVNRIFLSWEDDREHNDVLQLHFTRLVDQVSARKSEN